MAVLAQDPNEQADPAHIGIKIKDQNKGEVFFKIKRTTKFGNIIKVYCDRQEVDPKPLRFLFDGHRIQDDDTPEGLDMEDGDMVDAMLEQVGGDATSELEAEVEGAAAEGQPEGGNKLDIKVKDQYNNEVFFKIKATTPLSKVMDAYCQRQGIKRKSRRFLFEGTRIQDDQSLQALEIEDGNCIDCFVEQEGGRGADDCPITFLSLQNVNSTTYLNLRVRDEHHNVLIVRTKRDLPLEKALHAWCDATKKVFQDYVFLFQGTKVLMDRSARSVSMGHYNDILAVPNTYLDISVNYPPANKLHFKLKPMTRFGKLIREWCKRTGKNSSAMHFLFDGTRVKEGDTPTKLGMRSNETLEAFSEPIQTVNISVRVGNRTCSTLVPTMQLRLEHNSCLSRLKENAVEFLEVYGMSQYPFRLLFDGSRIQDDDTPTSLGMCDGDEIELWFEQLGGGDEFEDPQPKLEVLKLKVRNIYGSEVTFNVKPTTNLAKLRTAYANQQGQDVNSLRFCTSDGKRVLDEHTPEELELEDGDIIDVFLEQLGGGPDSDNSNHEEGSKIMTLKVRDKDGNNVAFKIKPTTNLASVMKAYAEAVEYRFVLPSGTRQIRHGDTAQSLQIEDGVVFDVFFEQQAADEASTEDKPKPKEECKHLNVVIGDLDGYEVHFKISRTPRLKKLMNVYASCQD